MGGGQEAVRAMHNQASVQSLPAWAGMGERMRILGSLIALLALTASAPALASDYTPERPTTERHVGPIQAAQEARVSSLDVRKDARPCDCSCARRADGERAATPRTEPERH